MNPYAIVGSGVGTGQAAALRARLMAWHDAMVAHERRLRSGQTSDVCDDGCPHVDARALWAEAVAMLGARANDLTFLRSRALASATSDQLAASGKSTPRRSESLVDSPRLSRIATAEL